LLRYISYYKVKYQSVT